MVTRSGGTAYEPLFERRFEQINTLAQIAYYIDE
jgi:hypothetical protein